MRTKLLFTLAALGLAATSAQARGAVTGENVKLSRRGQISIPKWVRETAHLTERMEFLVHYLDGQNFGPRY